MSRKFVIGDIHGGLKALKQVIEKINITDSDSFIFLGDYVDGWSDSPFVIDYLIEMNKNYKCIFIRGNHDDYCENWLKNNIANKNWLENGGRITIENYKNIRSKDREKHIDFLESTKPFYIDKKNRLFLHAGFTSKKGVKKEEITSVLYKDRSLWFKALNIKKTNPFEKEYNSFISLVSNYKEIYIGHTPTIKSGIKIPANRYNIWNIDTGAAFNGKLSIMNIKTKEFWQSNTLSTIYKGEKGRNK